ncbi:MAG: endonuclease, partial [Aquificota bacterium]
MERIYYTLLKKYGYQNWWPIYDGKEPFIEISVGAILTQNTSWKNVEKAILNLKRENLLTKEALKNVDERKLQKLIKPAGFYTRKSKTIKLFVEKIDTEEEIDREFLLSIKGIGKETADSILLYGLDKPFFVVDAYTIRIFSRLGLIDSSLKYDEIQKI